MADIKQVVKDFSNPISWVRIAIVLFVIFGVLWFRKPTQNVKIGQGGVGNFYNAPKRFLIPFIEGGVEQQQGRDLATYLRAGVRIEF